MEKITIYSISWYFVSSKLVGFLNKGNLRPFQVKFGLLAMFFYELWASKAQTILWIFYHTLKFPVSLNHF